MLAKTTILMFPTHRAQCRSHHAGPRNLSQWPALNTPLCTIWCEVLSQYRCNNILCTNSRSVHVRSWKHPEWHSWGFVLPVYRRPTAAAIIPLSSTTQLDFIKFIKNYLKLLSIIGYILTHLLLKEIKNTIIFTHNYTITLDLIKIGKSDRVTQVLLFYGQKLPHLTIDPLVGSFLSTQNHSSLDVNIATTLQNKLNGP